MMMYHLCLFIIYFRCVSEGQHRAGYAPIRVCAICTVCYFTAAHNHVIFHTLPLLLQIYRQLTTIHVSLSKHYVYVMIYEEMNKKQGPHHRIGRFLCCHVIWRFVDDPWTKKLKHIIQEFIFKTLNSYPAKSRKIWWAPNNASRWQMGFNSAFKGLILFSSRVRNTACNEGCILLGWSNATYGSRTARFRRNVLSLTQDRRNCFMTI